MITINTISNQRTIEGEEAIAVELRGLSTDEKPTQIANKLVDNGSVYIEIDTGKIYMYNIDNEQWMEI